MADVSGAFVAALRSGPKRIVVGLPLRTERLRETLLPKWMALAVFCSDPLSSVAYATEEILLMLGLAGMALLHLAWWVAGAVVVLLTVVVASYRQTCHAYPNGGGAYAVSRANLGRDAALIAASALLVDYVLTVAVSVVAGVANLASAFPSLAPHAVVISVLMVVALALVNLRGVRESGRVFAIPTYGFVGSILLLVAVGVAHLASGAPLLAPSAHYQVLATTSSTGAAAVLLVLRAFASGCTALTGVEAVSNGVPSFRPPKPTNAAATLTIMGVLAVTMFGGITALAMAAHVHVAAAPSDLVGQPAGAPPQTVLAQLATAVFGHSPLFFAVQGFTAAILVLAANTAFNGFPVLASILGEDGYLPRQFARRGDRLVFSNGILVLALLAAALIWLFDASTTRLIQLYIVGVFVSFTLSQTGMVRHWRRILTGRPAGGRRGAIHRSMAINAVGAVLTGLVLAVVLVTKFTHGAWIVVIAMPAIYLAMRAIHRHYDRVAAELRPPEVGVTLPARIHAVILVSRLHSPTLRALAFAQATRPDSLTAVTVRTSATDTEQLVREWGDRGIRVPLTVLESPYRDITGPVLRYVARLRGDRPHDVVVVFIPEYVVRHWWQQFLHNQSALRLKARLYFQSGVMVTSVPWRLGEPGPWRSEAARAADEATSPHRTDPARC